MKISVITNVVDSLPIPKVIVMGMHHAFHIAI